RAPPSVRAGHHCHGGHGLAWPDRQNEEQGSVGAGAQRVPRGHARGKLAAEGVGVSQGETAMKRLIGAIAISALAVGGTRAVATKKMVRQRVGEVNDKVDTLSKSVEETQQRTKANESRIGEVDQKAIAADSKAQAAGQRPDPAYPAADPVTPRADPTQKAAKKHQYEDRAGEAKAG